MPAYTWESEVPVTFGERLVVPAIKVKYVDSLEEYVSYVEKSASAKHKQLWFRGCGKTSHKLVPTLYRHNRCSVIDDFLQLEKDLLSRFRQGASRFTHGHLPTNGSGFF